MSTAKPNLHQNSIGRILFHRGIPLWRNVSFLKGAAQLVSAFLVIGVAVAVVLIFKDNASRNGVNLGFGFLSSGSGFTIPESIIPMDANRSYGYAFVAGLANTFRLVIIGMILTTILGVLIGLARLSSNWLLSKLATVYVEALRNIPVIVFAFFVYFGVVLHLPVTKRAVGIPDLLEFSNRGIYTPTLHWAGTFWIWAAIVLGTVVLAFFIWWLASRSLNSAARDRKFLLLGALIVCIVAALGWEVLAKPPATLSTPHLEGTNFVGGLSLTPEFFAILLSLTLYIATYIGEIVRGAIGSIPKGQLDAAHALGMNYWQTTLKIVLPQALRVIIPPLISQYVNYTKGSALGLVVGYVEVFTVTRTIIERSGDAPQMFLLVALAYMVIVGIFAGIGAVYNKRAQLPSTR